MFLQQAFQLFRVAFSTVKLVVRQLAPFGFDLAFHLLPLACKDIRITHDANSFWGERWVHSFGNSWLYPRSAACDGQDDRDDQANHE
jgi:hypothetical protein